MRKLPCSYEDNVDNAIYTIVTGPTDFLYDVGFTPNGVTTLSTISGLISIYNFSHNNYYMSALFFIIFYWLDCIDGFMARRYDMVTKFGDTYDHFKDILIIFIILYHLITTEMSIKIKVIMLIIIFASALSMTYQMSCQETYIRTHHIFGETMSDTLNDINICPAKNKKEAEDHLKISRYAGCGTFILIIALSIIFSGIAKRNSL